MADDTTTAIHALLTQVKALTETVEKQQSQLNGVRDFNTRILDEKKDMQRQLEEQAVSDKKWADMGFERGPDGNYYPEGTRPKHSLTREEARDPKKYRAAKDAATKAGAQLSIFDPEDNDDSDQGGRPAVKSTTTSVVKDRDQRIAYMRRDVMGSDTRQYQLLRADGFTVQSWDHPEDLPKHMQTKLALMEKSHDA